MTGVSASTIYLWEGILRALDGSVPNWRIRIERFGQVEYVRRREAGHHWNDNEVFEALLRAVLSNNTDWAKVQAVLPDLDRQFSRFSLPEYAKATDADIQRHKSWFLARRAGSMTLARSLRGLARAARLLQDWSAAHGSAEHYFFDVIQTCDGDAKQAALSLGRAGSSRKLPSLGIPIAAETLRNLGFDLCKPDRHLCRALGSFGLVQFRNWPNRSGTKPPQTNSKEMLRTMSVAELLAASAGERPTYVDTAIWLLCAKSGARFTNDQLRDLSIG